jgi:hypothetical protein
MSSIFHFNVDTGIGADEIREAINGRGMYIWLERYDMDCDWEHFRGTLLLDKKACARHIAVTSLAGMHWNCLDEKKLDRKLEWVGHFV